MSETAHSDADEPRLDLGPCCVCEQTGPQVCTILLLPFKAPVPGTGWGCMACERPFDGAYAVVCDRCLESTPRFIVHGDAASGGRVPLPDVPEPFDRDPARHPGEVFPESTL